MVKITKQDLILTLEIGLLSAFIIYLFHSIITFNFISILLSLFAIDMNIELIKNI